MLSWSLTFFILAVVAAVLGFGGLSVAIAGIAKFLFYLFLILFVLSFVFSGAQKADDVVDRNL